MHQLCPREGKILNNKLFGIEKCTRKQSLQAMLWATGLTAAALFSIYFTPTEYLLRLPGINSVNGCLLLTFTGIPCPACGMGRAFSCLTDLNISGSFYRNPSAPAFFVVSGFITAFILILSVFNYRIVFKESALRLWYIPVILLSVMWMLNILFGHH